MSTPTTITEQTVDIWGGRLEITVKVVGQAPTALPAPGRRTGMGPIPVSPSLPLHRLRS